MRKLILTVDTEQLYEDAYKEAVVHAFAYRVWEIKRPEKLLSILPDTVREAVQKLLKDDSTEAFEIADVLRNYWEELPFDEMENAISFTEISNAIDEYYSDYWGSELSYLKECSDDPQDLVLIDGNAGLWNGRREYFKQWVGSIDDFISRLSVADIKIEVYRERKRLIFEVYGYHHDGTNYYELVPLSHLTKQELKEILIEKEYSYSSRDTKEVLMDLAYEALH